MEPGRPSQTAVMVCTARALAHGATSVPGFEDPAAYALLPSAERARVDRIRDGAQPAGWREGVERVYLGRLATVMAVRTVAIDAAVRAASSPQVVILGAGLDGRAWRMPELRDAIVFEVDHPDSQRDKRARVPALPQIAREVRFVPVDFTHGSLDAALAGAGHDPALATTWIWEGVVMYLVHADVEATLAVVGRRSAPRSRLIVGYHAPAAILKLVGLVVRSVGEPLRSSYTPDGMRALLGTHGFAVARDEDGPTLAASMSREAARAMRFIRHLRIATADR